jgi:hypothetical protein
VIKLGEQVSVVVVGEDQWIAKRHHLTPAPERGLVIELLGGCLPGRRSACEAESPPASPAGVVRAVDSLLATPISGAIANALLLAHKGPPTELVGIEPREAFDPYGRHEPCTACAPLGSPGAGIGHEARQESS